MQEQKTRTCPKCMLKGYENRCKKCGIKFLGRKHQVYCSRQCNCENMVKKKKFYAYNSLSNELRDRVLDGEA